LHAVDADQANLQISYHLESLDDHVMPAFGVVGQPCFHQGSTDIYDSFALPPGGFELGLFDQQTKDDCSALTPLTTVALNVAAGRRALVVAYVSAHGPRLLGAPLSTP
jgi:hypothetical protein